MDKETHEENGICLSRPNRHLSKDCRREELELIGPSGKLLQQSGSK